MYLVSYQEFVEFLKSEEIKQHPVVLNEVPCIVMYKRGDILKAKIEVVNSQVFRWNEKFGLRNFTESENKYWIRGKEWT